MRVLVVSPARSGGVHQYAWQLASACAELGQPVTIARPAGSEALAGAPGGERTLPRAGRWAAPVAVALLSRWATAYDVVHFATPLWSPLDTLAGVPAVRRRARVSATCHELLPHVRKPLHGRVYRRYWRGLDGVAAHSSADAGGLAAGGVEPRRVAVVRMPAFLDALGAADPAFGLRAHLGLPAARPVVLFFGFVEPRKGLHDLIAALAGSAERCSLVVVGEPRERLEPYRAAATARGVDLILDAGLARYVPGPVAVAAMRDASVIVLPYRRGGSSAVLTTAATLGVPVIATDLTAGAEDLAHLPAAGVVGAGDAGALAAAVSVALAGGLRAPKPFGSWREAAGAYVGLWSRMAGA